MAAKAVVATHDAFDWDEAAEADLDTVILDFADPASVTAAEQLIYEISARSDPSVVDDDIRAFGTLAGEFIVPFSAFLSKVPRHGPSKTRAIQSVPPQLLKQIESLSKLVVKAHRDFDRLLNKLEEQRSLELWANVAVTWQKLNEIVGRFDLARREGSGVHAELARHKVAEGIPPHWIIRPLHVGALERDRNTIKMKLHKFAAGHVVGLCRQIAEVNMPATRFLVNAFEIEQVLRYDRLFIRSGLLRFAIPHDEFSPRALAKYQRDLEKLIRTEREFLRQLRVGLHGRSSKARHQLKPEKIPPIPPSRIETIKTLADKPTPAEQASTKKFRVIIHSLTNVEANGRRVGTDARRALLALRFRAGEKPDPWITFFMKELVGITRTPGSKTAPHKVWNRYKKALEKELPGVVIDGGPGEYTIYGLSFEDKLFFEDIRRGLLKRGLGQESKPQSTLPPNPPLK